MDSLAGASPEQAASIAGDFLEQADRRPAAWFWFSIVRTLFSLSFRSLLERPSGLAVLALKSYLFLFLWQIPAMFVGAILYINLTPPARDWAMYGTGVLGVVAAQFMVGRSLAKRSPGRELSAWLALIILATVIHTAIIFCTGAGWFESPLSLAWFLLYQIPVFTGAALVRRNTIRQIRY
jgi:hypothetical protein